MHGGIEIRFNSPVGSIYYIGGVFMKKLLGVLLAMALTWPVGATVLSNVEVKGEIQTIASDVRHDTEDGFYNRGAWTRAMAGLSADLVEDVTANILFQYAYMWGENNEGNNGFSNGEGIKLVNANVALHNLFCAFDLTVGRQFYGEDGSATIYFGPNHYNAEAGYYARALDAAKLTYSDDVKSVTLLAGRVADVLDGMFPGFELRSNIFGGDVKFNVNENFTAGAYLYDFTDGTATDGEEYHHVPADMEWDHIGVWGAKLGMNVEAVRASVEYARNFAGKRFIKEHGAGHAGIEDLDELGTGYMVKADIAADIEKVTARGTFIYAKEGFLSQGNYAPGLLMGHPMSGYGMLYNIFGYSDLGLRMFNLGFDFKPADKWTVSLDGYAFQGRNGQHAATWEADLTAKYAHNEYVELFAGVGYVKYGNDEGMVEYLKEEAGPDNFKGQLGMLIKF